MGEDKKYESDLLGERFGEMHSDFKLRHSTKINREVDQLLAAIQLWDFSVILNVQGDFLGKKIEPMYAPDDVNEVDWEKLIMTLKRFQEERRIVQVCAKLDKE